MTRLATGAAAVRDFRPFTTISICAGVRDTRQRLSYLLSARRPVRALGEWFNGDGR
jgi:hypothetical protein